MKPADSPNRSDRESELPALAWVRREGAEDELLRDVATKLRRRRLRRAGIASAVAGIAVLAFVFARGVRPEKSTGDLAAPPLASAPVAPAAPTSSVVVTRPELRTLADGTVVELHAQAEIAVAFTAEARRVTLVRGTAHFQVAKDPAHPFIVRAGKVEARAVGTAFTVQLGAQEVDVLVTEGLVGVTTPTASGTISPPTMVEAGRRCLVEGSAPPKVEPLPLEELAWRIPQIEFSRTPLQEVIARVNEQTVPLGGSVFEIADASIREIKLSGLLRADNTAALERLLETSFNLEVERYPGRIVLRPRR